MYILKLFYVFKLSFNIFFIYKGNIVIFNSFLVMFFLCNCSFFEIMIENSNYKLMVCVWFKCLRNWIKWKVKKDLR